MKKILYGLLFAPFISFGQGFVDFEDANLPEGANYADGQFEQDGITFYYYHCKDETGNQEDDFPIDGKGLMLRRASDSYFEFTVNNGIGEFSFDYRKAYTGGSPRELELIINDEQVTTTGEFGEGTGVQEDIYSFSYGVNTEGVVTVKIKNVGDAATNKQAVIDNISWTNFDEPIGNDCPEIEGLYFEGATENEGYFSWEPGGDPEGTVWEVVYGEPGFDPNTEGTVITTDSPVVDIDGLTPGTEYEVYVRTSCGNNEYSDWTGPVSFTTDGEEDPCLGFEASIAGETVMCEGDSILLTVNTDAQDYTIVWSNGSESETIAVYVAGTYNVTITNEFDCTATASIEITTNPLPTIEGIEGEVEGTIASFNAINVEEGDEYLWEFGDGNTSNEESPSHEYEEDGEYVVILTVSNDCGQVTATTTVLISTVGLEVNNLSNINIYPNPSSSIVNITLDDSSQLELLVVINSKGQIVYKGNETLLNVEKFNNGLYHLNVILSNGQTIQRNFQVVK